MEVKAKAWALVVSVFLACQCSISNASDTEHKRFSLGKTVAQDYRNFTKLSRLGQMGIGFLGLGLLANSDVDANVQEWYQQDIRNSDTDDLAEIAKQFGEGDYLIPLSLLAASTLYLKPDTAVGTWGARTARAYAVGGPAMLMMQRFTGASRPQETRLQSRWKPMEDEHGVSGHAFVGAVPFLTLAKQYEDNKWIKYPAVAASALTAWSRLNDDKHYLSQAILGWMMAYEAVGAVSDTNHMRRKVEVAPSVDPETFSFGAAIHVNLD